MRRVLALVTISTVLVLIGGIAVAAPALAAPIQISEDPYTDAGAQHKTQVEPDSFAFGSTIVAVFQTGRTFGGGASNIGWATSTNGGANWVHGFMPGTTPVSTPPGIYSRVSDPAVAYDPKRGVWMASILGLRPNGINDIVTSRSTDGGLTWGNPVMTAAGPPGSFYDKNWITCDTSATSPFRGNCYTQWDDAGDGNLMLMSTSTDGGLTWGPPKPTANNERSTIAGQPVVLANGTVVVPFRSLSSGQKAFRSTDGGNTWSAPVLISNVQYHTPAGGIRAPFAIPSAEVRHPGPIVLVWGDCRFEPGCSANDIVMSTSTDGINWSPVRRIPLDPIGSGVDHFLPGVAIQGQTLFASLAPHIALGYYYYPVAACSQATCQLHVGFSFSANGGGSWSPPQTLAGPMMLSWLAQTSQGPMVGDYISTSYVGQNAFPIYASATAPIGGVFQEHMFTSQQAATSFVGPTLRASSAGGIYGRPTIVKAGATAN
jgi:BNR repeat-like domain